MLPPGMKRLCATRRPHACSKPSSLRRTAGKLADAFAAASSPAVARYLWRLLATIERGQPEHVLHATLFALPVILVSALEAHEGEITLSGVLPDARALEALLRDESEFGGARTLALSTTLIDAAAIDLARLPGFIAHRALDETQRKDRLSAARLANRHRSRCGQAASAFTCASLRAQC